MSKIHSKMFHALSSVLRSIAHKMGLTQSSVLRSIAYNSGLMQSTEEILEILNPMDTLFRSRLLSMYRGEPQYGLDGKRHSIDTVTRISPSKGMFLYNFCLSTKPKRTIEIGMAYGYSTIFFIAAIMKNGCGHHTAIDPYESSAWHGIGRTHADACVPQSGSNSVFRFIEDRSDRAAADLARSQAPFDLIFIDGNHRFDDVLVDFYLYSRICVVGGHIILDDMWMSSIKTVVAFLRTNRTDFIELPTPHSDFCVFKKTGEDERSWQHFNRFPVAQSTAPHQ